MPRHRQWPSVKGRSTLRARCRGLLSPCRVPLGGPRRPFTEGHCRSRAAFTVVELLVVIGIITMLAAITTPTILASIQKATIEGAMNRLLKVHSTARRLAMGTPPLPVGEAVRCYGLALVVDDGMPYATVICGTAATDELLVDEDRDGSADRPFQREVLGPVQVLALDAGGLNVFEGTGRIAWFYQPGTGAPLPRAAKAGKPTVYEGRTIEIGTPGQLATPTIYLTDPSAAPAAATTTFKTTTDTKTYDVLRWGTPAIAPSPVARSIVLQLPDGRLRHAFAVYRSGMANLAEL